MGGTIDQDVGVEAVETVTPRGGLDRTEVEVRWDRDRDRGPGAEIYG